MAKNHKAEYDRIFGSGSYDEGTEWARRIGTGIGQAKLAKRLREEAEAEAERERKKQEKLLEAANKEAAKKERERKETEAKEKKEGKKQSELAKQIEDKKKRLKAEGVDSAKKQSAFGKKMNLDPDQNWFMDGLELLGRPTKAVIGAMSDDAKRLKQMQENTKEAKKDLKAGKISEKDFDKILGGKNVKGPSWGDRLEDAKDAFMGEKKTSGSKLLGERFGMKKGIGRGVAGFGLEVALDPLNLVGALPAKGLQALSKTKAVAKTAKAVREAPVIKPTLDVANDIFSGSRKMTQSLTGGTTDALKDLTRSLENRRLSMQDRSTDAIASAMRKGGKDGGIRTGQAMEAPLRFGRGTDPLPPNVANMQGAMPSPLGLGRVRSQAVDTSFSTVGTILSNGVKPNAQQKLDWGSKKLLPTRDNNAYINAGAFGEWGTKPPPEVVAEVKQVIGNIKEPAAAAETLLQQPAIRAKYRQAANTLIESNADVRKFAQENGIEVSDLEGYMAHFATKEAQKHLDEVGTASSSGQAKVGGDSRVNKRKIQDSVTNANIKMKKTTNIDQFFTPDAFVATAGGQQRMINFIAAESMKKNVIANPQLAREIPSGTKARKGFVHMDIDGKRFEMTKGAAEGITNFEKHVTDEGINAILKGYDTLQSMWKKTALFSAGFHIRNFVGNSWNMYVSGMRPDQIVARMGEGLSVADVRAARAGKDVKKLNPEIAKHYDDYISQGLRGSGQMADFSKDAAAQVMSDARVKTKSIFNPSNMFHEWTEIGKADGVGGKLKAGANAMFDGSRRLGDEADEVARFALFRHHMKAGKSAEEAAAKVREVLFDYSALTKAENEVFRRAMPFYTFMRKNAEFQMKSFMKSPEKYNRLMQAKDNAYANADADEGITPDYLKDGFAIPLPGTDRMLNFNLPAADLNKLTNPGKMALDAVTPFAKLPFELASNTQLLNGAPIEQFEGQDGSLFGKTIPSGLGGKKTEHAIKNLVSPARNISGAMDESMKDASGFDKAAQFLGGNVAKRYDQESFQNQADYAENKRLGDIIKKSEKQDGKDVRTISELNKAGIATDEKEKEEQKFLKDAGYNRKQRDMLLSLKKKVYDNGVDTSLEVRSLLESMGIDEEVIEMITSDYLEY